MRAPAVAASLEQRDERRDGAHVQHGRDGRRVPPRQLLQRTRAVRELVLRPVEQRPHKGTHRDVASGRLRAKEAEGPGGGGGGDGILVQDHREERADVLAPREAQQGRRGRRGAPRRNRRAERAQSAQAALAAVLPPPVEKQRQRRQ